LKTAEVFGKFDVVINATGGGLKGQAEAAKLGIARALLEALAKPSSSQPPQATMSHFHSLPRILTQ
jgi:ribosomal protein S9